MIPIYLLAPPLSATVVVARQAEAADCPDAERLSAQVERIVGRPLVTSEGTLNALTFRVEFSRSRGTYEAKLRSTGAREGERVLRDDGPSCTALGDAVAVTTALLLDRSEPVRAEPAAARKSEAASWLGWWFSGHLGAGAGLVGAPIWVAGGAIEASLGYLGSIDLGAALTGEDTSTLGRGAVRVQLWYVEAGGFRSLTGERFQVGPRFQIMGGALRGAGEGYAFSSSASSAWFALAAGIGGDARLGPLLRLGARALAVIPTRKHSFSIANVGTPYESSSLGGMAELVLGVKLW